MRIAIVSDPHGNVGALRHAVEFAREASCDEIWCLGDLVGGNQSGATVDLARQQCQQVIAGNHDLVVAGRLHEEYVSTHGGPAVLEARASLSPEQLAYLEGLGTEHSDHGICAVHASITSYTIGISDAYFAASQLAISDDLVLAVGHSHQPFFYVDEDDRWVGDALSESSCSISGGVVVGPGSVAEYRGAPGTLAIIDLDSRRCFWHRLS